MASENHFNQTVVRRDRGWHRRALYVIRALPVVIGRNTQSGFYWITVALYWRGFTVIEQLYGRWGDSQMVLIKLWADSYYMPYCSLTLLEAYSSTLMLKSSHIFNDCDTYAYDYPLIRHQSSQISYIKKKRWLIQLFNADNNLFHSSFNLSCTISTWTVCS